MDNIEMDHVGIGLGELVRVGLAQNRYRALVNAVTNLWVQ
jgi:hypothetical protein